MQFQKTSCSKNGYIIILVSYDDCFRPQNNIRSLHECEVHVLIEKSVPWVIVWHHEAHPSDAKL